MSDTTIVVTGATGRSGQEVVRHLLGKKHVRVRAAVHHRHKAHDIPSHVEVVEIEQNDPRSVEAALRGADKLFWVTPGGVEQVPQTAIMVPMAQKLGIKHIVKLGNIGCDEEPIYETDRQCFESEQAIAKSGIDHTFLRGSWFNQIFVSGDLLAQIRQGAAYMMFTEGKTGWLDCRDIGAIGATVLTEPGHHGKTYNMTGPEPLSFGDIGEIMSNVAGRTIQFVKLSEDVVRQMFAHEPAAVVDARIGCLAKLRDGYIENISNDVERLLGRPAISFEQFTRDYAEILFAGDAASQTKHINDEPASVAGPARTQDGTVRDTNDAA